MISLELNPTIKQGLALQKLHDDVTEFLLFGGGAGGGKSWVGCEWLLEMCLAYPGTKWFIGRNELKRLMISTFVTFQKVCKWHNIPKQVIVGGKLVDTWKLDGKYNIIKFYNGSTIDLLDVSFKPSDPLFERFGSTEYTGGWLEEVGEQHFGAFDVLKSRINRHLNDVYNIPPKLLLTCNPKRNWVYLEFYKPYTQNKLDEGYEFIESLYTDNPYTSKSYGKTLSRIKSVQMKERLMKGNWEYENDPAILAEYDACVDMFSNTFIEKGERYLISDLAMKGRDRLVITLWEGLRCKILYHSADPIGGKEIEQKIRDYAEQYKVARSYVCHDSDGLGNYLESYMHGVREFKGGFAAEDPEYANLRSECYFKLAELINKREIYVECEDLELQDTIITELQQIKQINVDNDESKKRVIKKEDIKNLLAGRSPDYSDVLMMRMVYLVGCSGESAVVEGDEIFG